MDITVPFVIGAATLAGVVVIAPVTKYALDMYPYLFANTRLSSRLGLLLDKKGYDELLAATSSKEAFGLLEDSYYSSIVEHATDFFSFSDALDKDLYETYVWVHSVTPEPLQGVVSSLLKRFEILQLKFILNALQQEEAVGEIDFVMDPSFKIKLEGVRDVASLMNAVEGTMYESVFQNLSLDRLQAVNNSLDRLYIDQVGDAIAQVKDTNAVGPFVAFHKVLIDLFNIRLTYRSINKKHDEEFISHGTLSLESLSGVTDAQQLESVLSSSSYGEALKGTDGTTLEQSLFQYVAETADTLQAQHSLKAGTLIRFLLKKDIEIRNLQSIMKLKESGMATEKIRDEVIA